MLPTAKLGSSDHQRVYALKKKPGRRGEKRVVGKKIYMEEGKMLMSERSPAFVLEKKDKLQQRGRKRD